jgi:hypothetical protein
MAHFFDLDSEPNCFEQTLCRYHGVEKCPCADNGPRWRIGNAKQKVPAALVCYGDAVPVELVRVVLRLGFLELEALMLRRGLAPEIDLLRRRRHSSRCLSGDVTTG